MFSVNEQFGVCKKMKSDQPITIRRSQAIEETQGHAPNYPMVGDPTLAIAKA